MSTVPSNGFDGLRVAIFEARMAGELASLVAKHGGVPVAAAAMREVPLGAGPEILAFVEGLEAGAYDVVIFETGVGIRYLVEAVGPRFRPEAWADALRRTKVVARGPKPAAALRELGAPIHFLVPAPNTWRETLALLDASLPVAGRRVAVQEYGKPVVELTDGLEARGAIVTRVPVYRWSLPEDIGPLRSALHTIVAGEVDAVLFTSAQQVEYVLEVAESEGIADAVRQAISTRVIVGSVGPTTSSALQSYRLPVDIEPSHPKSGHLVAALASGWRHVKKPTPAAE